MCDGEFSIAGQMNCTICDAGYYCPYKDSNIQLPCASGYYSLGGQNICTACPAGYECNDSSQEPVECVDGYYSPAASSKLYSLSNWL